jgi:hypothetical protein
MQLDLNGLPDVLELDVKSLDDAVFGYGLFFFLDEPDECGSGAP